MQEEIIKRLIELSDEKYKKFHEKLCFTKNKILGVRIPVLRNYAKELLKFNNAKYILENIGNRYYEEIMLQGMIIGLSKEKDLNIVQEQIEKYISKIDNWAICDTFCAGLKITKKYKNEMWDFINKYLSSENEFEIRFAVVMILDYYIEEKYLKDIFNIFDNLYLKNRSNQYYVQMAVAWAISICLVKFYDETLKYLEKSKIDKFTFNKSIQKAIESYRINKEQKDELKELIIR